MFTWCEYDDLVANNAICLPGIETVTVYFDSTEEKDLGSLGRDFLSRCVDITHRN